MDRVRVSVRGFDERVRFRFRVLGGRGGLGKGDGVREGEGAGI